jgi:hypothetical protein
MLPSRVRRILTTLWACWFVLLLNEPLQLHACPMHDGPSVVAARAGGETGAGHNAPKGEPAHDAAAHVHGSPDAAAMAPASGGAGDGDTRHGDHDGEGTHSCSCLGHCASSSVSTAIAVPVPFAWLAGIIDIAPAQPHAHEPAFALAEHVLPFANGPPRLTRA